MRGSLSNGRRAMRTTVTVTELRKTLPANVAVVDYYSFWTFHDTTYFSDAQMTRDGTVKFFDGIAATDDSGATTFTTLHEVPGKLKLGRRGTVAIDVPFADVGSPAAGDRFTHVNGQVLVAYDPNDALQNVVDAGGPVQDYVVRSGCVPPAAAVVLDPAERHRRRR